MSFKLFVGNLPYDVTEAELREHFSSVGPLASVYMVMDRETGRPRGFAFVEFSDRAQGEEAIRRLNNYPMKGRPLVINEAKAREDRGTERRDRPSRPPQGDRSRVERPSSWPREAQPVQPPSEKGDYGSPSRRPRKQKDDHHRSEHGSRGQARSRRGGRSVGKSYDDYGDDWN